MGLLSTLRDSRRLRLGAIGAVSGAVAGILAVNLTGSFVQRYGMAVFFGLIVYVALRLVVEP
jgi:ammonia channel protein AmtB